MPTFHHHQHLIIIPSHLIFLDKLFGTHICFSDTYQQIRIHTSQKSKIRSTQIIRYLRFSILVEYIKEIANDSALYVNPTGENDVAVATATPTESVTYVEGENNAFEIEVTSEDGTVTNTYRFVLELNTM